MLWQGSIFMGIPLLFYIVTSYYYIHLLPIAYPVSDQINKNLTDLQPFFTRFSDVNGKLLFSDLGITLYGYIVYLTTFLLLFEILFYFIPDRRKKRAADKSSTFWILAILTVYLGVPLIGFLLPLADLDNTTKRELFKLCPILVIYLSHNRLVQALSKKIPV
jgi:hypothetical protein